MLAVFQLNAVRGGMSSTPQTPAVDRTSRAMNGDTTRKRWLHSRPTVNTMIVILAVLSALRLNVMISVVIMIEDIAPT